MPKQHDPIAAAIGYAPDVDVHGDALSSIEDPPGAVERADPRAAIPFEAYDRASGQKIIVDDRLFDARLHSRDPIEPPVESA